MNKLIKEFLDEATEIHDDRNTGVSYPVVDHKIFAELIIKKCASICYNSKLKDSDAHAQNLLYEFNIDGAKDEK